MSTSGGEIKAYYDPNKSQRGMTLCAMKAAKRKVTKEYFSTEHIVTRKFQLIKIKRWKKI
jgi:hypothetical protein